MQAWQAMRLPTVVPASPFSKERGGLKAQRVTASEPSFVDGCPSRRSLVLGFLIHSVQKSAAKNLLHSWFPNPCKSVFSRGSLSESYSSGVLRHAIRLSAFWEKDKVRGCFWFSPIAIRCVIGTKAIPHLNSSPFVKGEADFLTERESTSYRAESRHSRARHHRRHN